MHRSPKRDLLLLLSAAGGIVALSIAFTGSLVLAGIAGLIVPAVAALVVWGRVTKPDVPDPGRRRFLGLLAGAGVALVGAGTGLGQALRRLARPDPGPALERMARDLGTEALELVVRAYHPERSGDLQLLVTPFSSSNYAQESTSLVPNDPRTSHAAVWMYLERVPIAVYAPGIVEPGLDSTERVTLADLAPTTAALMGFDARGPRDGRPLPGIVRPARAPKVIVTFVIDGGGWNVLRRWPDAWPNLKRLMRNGATYRNAIVGSFPAVTASSHATIGTGAFPRSHGITGHNVRRGGGPVKAWGTPGRADPSFLLLPTLADAWSEATGDGAWIGEIGYQVWHIGMIGRGGRPLGDLPVGVFWDEEGGGGWLPHNPDLYRMPRRAPDRGRLAELEGGYGPPPPSPYDPTGRKAMCCAPPIVRYQGELIEAAFDSEPIGEDDVTDLLYTTFKAPDYAGHVYNMDDPHQATILASVDAELGRLADLLESRFAPGEFVLIATADHGQCPPIDESGGVRVDPIQLDEDLAGEFGGSVFRLVQSVVPSEVYLDRKALWDTGATLEDVAAFLGDYRYGDNIGPYVPAGVVLRDRLRARPFAAVLPTSFIAELAGTDLSAYGPGRWADDPNVDPGIPDITW